MATAPRRPGLVSRLFASRFAAVLAIVTIIVAVWYVAAIFMNAAVVRSTDKRAGIERTTTIEFIAATYEMKRPILPAPHQIVVEVYNTTVKVAPTSKKSLLFHGWVTLSSTMLGFAIGTALGIFLAVLIVHVRSLELSLMPWIVSSQTIPILAIAPMVIVVFAAINITGLVPKAFISTYLSFFPVTVGMVKGFRSPEPLHLDLLRTYSAGQWQTFWKLRWPSSLPFLFVSMKVAIAASLVGAIVGELPTGAVAGLGARLLTGSYYGQTIQIWSALIGASVMAAFLVAAVGIAQRIALRRSGAPS
ncbi:MAG: ABC transporter permease [Alphaproteobacteria bacterium]